MTSQNDNNRGKGPWDPEERAVIKTFPWTLPPEYLSRTQPHTSGQHRQTSDGETKSSGSSARSLSTAIQYSSGDTPPTSPHVYLGKDADQGNQNVATPLISHVDEASIRLEDSLRRLGLGYFNSSPVVNYPKLVNLRPEAFSAGALGPIGPPAQSSLVTPPHSRNVSDESSYDRQQYDDELANNPSMSLAMPNKTIDANFPSRTLSRFSGYAEAARTNTGILRDDSLGRYALSRPATFHEGHPGLVPQMYQSLSRKQITGDLVRYNQDPNTRQSAQFESSIPPAPANADFEARQLLPSTLARTQRFRPMQAITNRASFPPAPLQAQLTPAAHATTRLSSSMDSKFSLRYHGMHNEANASAEHIPDELNCAVWITNLPPDVTYTQLLQVLTKTGRVWCTYINEPDYVDHKTAAAKAVYFTPDAAQRLLAMSWTSGLHLRGHSVRVSRNRIKSSPHATRDISGAELSRVLIITGASSFVNPESLTDYFSDLFIFQTDEILVLVQAAGRSVVEFRFGSYRCQAQMGKMALEKDRPVGFLKVEFGKDPCEFGEDLTSFSIAVDRIQGKGI